MFTGAIAITNKGKALQAKVQAGTALNYTRIAIGDGSLSGQQPADLNVLISEKKTISITRLKTQPGGVALVGGLLSNQSYTTGFYLREIGVFAQDPDVGEVLYCYGNDGANAGLIPAGGGTTVVERNLDILTLTGNASNVTATIDSSLVFVKQSDFDAHTSAGNAHGSTSAASASKIIQRDANGRAQVADPAVASDIMTKNYGDTNFPMKSTSVKTYYVSPTGADTNDGLTAGTPFKTIGKAVGKVPQVMNHEYKIFIADGTYDEDMNVDGIIGTGFITIVGNNTTPANVKVRSIRVHQTKVYVEIDGMTVTGIASTGNSIIVDRVRIAQLSNVVSTFVDHTRAGFPCVKF